jgi:hypothetical protein
MYTIIEAECILANMLQRYEKVSIRDLNEARAAIEKAVSTVCVDLTTNSLIRAVKRRSEMFAWEDDTFRRLKTWPSTRVEESFNWQIPEDVRHNVLKALDDVEVQ